MMNKIKIAMLMATLFISTPIHASMDDDPILTKVTIDQLEKRNGAGSAPWVLEADAWIGKDLHKLWFKLDAEKLDGRLEEFEMQALYSHAVDPYWDFQIGWKHNSKPEPSSDWLALGFKGLSPYWIEIDAAAFIADNGQINLRLNAEYELMLSQQWVLSPEAEINIFSKDDARHEIGSGLSDIQIGLRLRYEIHRELAPYIGLHWTQKYSGTAEHARINSEDTHDVKFVAGIRVWF